MGCSASLPLRSSLSSNDELDEPQLLVQRQQQLYDINGMGEGSKRRGSGGSNNLSGKMSSSRSQLASRRGRIKSLSHHHEKLPTLDEAETPLCRPPNSSRRSKSASGALKKIAGITVPTVETLTVKPQLKQSPQQHCKGIILNRRGASYQRRHQSLSQTPPAELGAGSEIRNSRESRGDLSINILPPSISKHSQQIEAPISRAVQSIQTEHETDSKRDCNNHSNSDDININNVTTHTNNNGIICGGSMRTASGEIKARASTPPSRSLALSKGRGSNREAFRSASKFVSAVSRHLTLGVGRSLKVEGRSGAEHRKLVIAASFDDNYQIGVLLGRGSFGDVFECTHKKTGKKFAVKTMRRNIYAEGTPNAAVPPTQPHTQEQCGHRGSGGEGYSNVQHHLPNSQHPPLADQKRQRRQTVDHSVMFYNEVHTLISLSHPNIVRIHEVYDSGERLQAVLELCTGGDLFKYISRCIRTFKQKLVQYYRTHPMLRPLSDEAGDFGSPLDNTQQPQSSSRRRCASLTPAHKSTQKYEDSRRSQHLTQLSHRQRDDPSAAATTTTAAGQSIGQRLIRSNGTAREDDTAGERPRPSVGSESRGQSSGVHNRCGPENGADSRRLGREKWGPQLSVDRIAIRGHQLSNNAALTGEGYNHNVRGLVVESEISGHSNGPLVAVQTEVMPVKRVLTPTSEYMQNSRPRGPLNEQHIAELARLMLQSIEYVHSMGLVHRDIKAQNFLFTDLPSPAAREAADDAPHKAEVNDKMPPPSRRFFSSNLFRQRDRSLHSNTSAYGGSSASSARTASVGDALDAARASGGSATLRRRVHTHGDIRTDRHTINTTTTTNVDPRPTSSADYDGKSFTLKSPKCRVVLSSATAAIFGDTNPEMFTQSTDYTDEGHSSSHQDDNNLSRLITSTSQTATTLIKTAENVSEATPACSIAGKIIETDDWTHTIDNPLHPSRQSDCKHASQPHSNDPRPYQLSDLDEAPPTAKRSQGPSGVTTATSTGSLIAEPDLSTKPAPAPSSRVGEVVERICEGTDGREDELTKIENHDTRSPLSPSLTVKSLSPSTRHDLTGRLKDTSNTEDHSTVDTGRATGHSDTIKSETRDANASSFAARNTLPSLWTESTKSNKTTHATITSTVTPDSNSSTKYHISGENSRATPDRHKRPALQRLVLIDFGMAAKVSSAAGLRTLCGSPHYVAPEILKQSYGCEVDIWAFGIIVYLMVYGRYPFDGKDRQTILKKIQSEKPAFPAECPGGPSRLIVDFLKMCLHADPLKRLTATQALRHPWLLKGGPDKSRWYPVLASTPPSPDLRVRPLIQSAKVQRVGITKKCQISPADLVATNSRCEIGESNPREQIEPSSSRRHCLSQPRPFYHQKHPPPSSPLHQSPHFSTTITPPYVPRLPLPTNFNLSSAPSTAWYSSVTTGELRSVTARCPYRPDSYAFPTTRVSALTERWAISSTQGAAQNTRALGTSQSFSVETHNQQQQQQQQQQQLRCRLRTLHAKEGPPHYEIQQQLRYRDGASTQRAPSITNTEERQINSRSVPPGPNHSNRRPSSPSTSSASSSSSGREEEGGADRSYNTRMKKRDKLLRQGQSGDENNRHRQDDFGQSDIGGRGDDLTRGGRRQRRRRSSVASDHKMSKHRLLPLNLAALKATHPNLFKNIGDRTSYGPAVDFSREDMKSKRDALALYGMHHRNWSSQQGRDGAGESITDVTNGLFWHDHILRSLRPSPASRISVGESFLQEVVWPCEREKCQGICS